MSPADRPAGRMPAEVSLSWQPGGARLLPVLASPERPYPGRHLEPCDARRLSGETLTQPSVDACVHALDFRHRPVVLCPASHSSPLVSLLLFAVSLLPGDSTLAEQICNALGRPRWCLCHGRTCDRKSHLTVPRDFTPERNQVKKSKNVCK